YQLYRQADGSWTGAAPAAADLGEFGEYRATVWATYGSESRGWVTATVSIHDGDCKIMSQGVYSSSSMIAAFARAGAAFPADVYSAYGAGTITEFCSLVLEESASEGVNPYVVFAQSMLETGWLKFGGQVKPEQCNFGGIGALDNGVQGASFNSYGLNSVRIGIRAQVQHLKAYASCDNLVNACVDPRFQYVKRGSCPFVSMLGGKWASDPDYGYKILRIVSSLYSN
ncbi:MULTISPECIES: glucosaminidase domain-containing protein, partial [unclassified Collinsella]|uniref:glucosaminidase domain-containing protein n=1 Tax=unclassified Collinsella TaxID=2637548 RepID=UPI00132B178A